MKIKEIIRTSNKKVRELGKEEPVVIILLEYMLKMNGGELYLHQDDELDEGFIASFEKNLGKYLYENIPVQHITNSQIFYGYDFYVNSDVLIPRSETEELTENIIYFCDEYFPNQQLDIVDIGSGSGAIGITLGLEVKDSKITLTDISNKALEVAKKNGEKLRVKATYLLGDMLEPLGDTKYDIIVSNPPYIPDSEVVDPLVLDNEPNIALFGGGDGLKFYRVILKGIKKNLKTRSLIAFEHGFEMKEALYNLATYYFPNAKVIQKKDMKGKDRMTFILVGIDNE